MSQLISEAFKELKMLNEDTFSFDKEGVLDLSKFLKLDNQVSTLNVIDPQAEVEDELEPNYTGKAVLQCCVCKQPIYVDPADVIVDEETQRANVGEECPHCYNIGGYKVIGQVQPLVDDEIRATVDGEEVEIEEKEEVTESLNESFEIESIDDYIEDVSHGYGWVTFDKAMDDLNGVYNIKITDEELSDWIDENSGKATTFSFDDEVVIMTPFAPSYKEIALALGFDEEDASKYVFNEDTVKQNGKWVNKGKEGTHGTFKTKKAADAQRKAMFAQGYKESLNEGSIHNTFSIWTASEGNQLTDFEDGVDFEAPGDLFHPDEAEYNNAYNNALNKAIEKAKKLVPHRSRVVIKNTDYTYGGDRYSRIIWDSRKDLKEEYFDDRLKITVKEEDINHFDEETGDIIIDSSLFEGKDLKESDYIKIHFDDESEGVEDQEFKFIRKTEDGYQFEWLGIETGEEIDKSLSEDFTKATVETGESVLSMESNNEGKVTVTSEPRKVEESGEGMLAPVSDEVKAEIEADSEEEVEDIEIEGEVDEPVDVEVEEIEEEGFDELGESYLKKVYDNVKSFKTISGAVNENKIKLDGIITFNSGKRAKTSFIFESTEISKRGKVRFLGENVQLTKKKNAFTLQGSIKDHKLMVESLTYNYRAQDTKSKNRISLYGTVKRK